MNEIDLRAPSKTRAEDTQPGGFVPSHLAEPMLRDRNAHRTQLEYVAEGLGEIRAAADVLDSPLAEVIGAEAGRLQRLVKALAVGALALLVVGGVTFGGGGARAEAAEAPQPDPVAQTVRVTLGSAPTTVYVRATVYTETAPGWWCASVWSARGRIGGTCSTGATFPVPVTIDPRTFPAGRTFAQVVDDATDTAVANVTLDARRPSRFLAGTWQDLGQGREYVAAPVQLYSPTVGRWVAQQSSPVYVRELTRRGWRTRAALTTNRYGVAAGIVNLGGGVHAVRVERPAGLLGNVWGAVGTTRHIVTTTEPLDVD